MRLMQRNYQSRNRGIVTSRQCGVICSLFVYLDQFLEDYLEHGSTAGIEGTNRAPNSALETDPDSWSTCARDTV